MEAMSSDSFYSDLPILADFAAISDFSKYAELPEDWQIVVADVEDSTGAIAAGQYKAVNILGVSIITSVLNIAQPLIIPSVFGGDGAALAIPARLAEDASKALVDVKMLALSQYGLNLRVGIVPVKVIKSAGYKILVARHRISESYLQAAFAGGGIEYAENLLKHETDGAAYRLQEREQTQVADFSGLECRWDNVPSKHGETISLIVKAIANDFERESHFYNEVIAKIEDIYGNDETSHPLHSDGLQLRINEQQLGFETKLKTFAKSKLAQMKYYLMIRFEVLLGIFLMGIAYKDNKMSWGDYKQEVVSNTDFKKFDGTLRQVLSGTAEQRLQLTDYLDACHKKGDCVFGIHTSNSALVTCLINNRADEHYHFVDGADGGYAMAAAAMKKQLQSLS